MKNTNIVNLSDYEFLVRCDSLKETLNKTKDILNTSVKIVRGFRDTNCNIEDVDIDLLTTAINDVLNDDNIPKRMEMLKLMYSISFLPSVNHCLDKYSLLRTIDYIESILSELTNEVYLKLDRLQ